MTASDAPAGAVPKRLPSRIVLAAVAVLLLAFIGYELFAHRGATLWTGPVGLLWPDLAFLLALGANQARLPRRAVVGYNLVHRPWLPLALLLVVALDDQTNAQAAPYFVFALAWLAHIAIDRALGFRLRDRDGRIRD